MQRPEAETGRRPLLLGQNRQMLQEIRDNLRHLQKNPQPSEGAGRNDISLKGDLSQSTPNLVEKMGNGSKNMSRHGYNKNAMARIRQSLANYEIQEASPGLTVPNSQGMEVIPVNEHMLQQMKQMGWDEDLASRALKMTGSKSVDAAVEFIQNLTHLEGKNGFDRTLGPGFPVSGYGTKVIRKPSFEEKYRQGSPVNSENSSVRSESPSLGGHRQYGDNSRTVCNNGPSTGSALSDRSTPPPPLPPRGVPPTHTPPPPPPLPSQVWVDAGTGQVVHQQQGMTGTGNYMPSGMRKLPPMLPHKENAFSTVPQSWANSNNGPVLPPRGLSPVSGRQPPVIMQNTLQHSPSGRDILQQQHLQGVETQAVITGPQGGQRFAVPYGYPPPYPQGQLLPNKPSPTSIPMQMHEQSHMIVPQFQGNNSPMSHSPSPGRVPSPAQPPSPAMQIYGQIAASPNTPPGQIKPPAPMQAWEAKQSPIIMQKVNSREVQKPILQTATAPPIPQPTHQIQQQKIPQSQTQLQQATPQQQFWQQQQPNYVSSVQAQVNTPPTQGAAPPPPPQPLPKRATQTMRDVQIEISRPQLPGYRIQFNSKGQGQKNTHKFWTIRCAYSELWY